MIVINNGFELDEYNRFNYLNKNFKRDLGISEEEKVVVSVGRWHSVKDYPNLLGAIKILSDKGLKFKCLLVGTGLEKSNCELMKLIDKEKIDDKVILLGRSDKIPFILSNSDIYVLHSAGEGFPNSLGEAMACGVPCIATDVGDCRRMLDAIGTIVESENARELSKAMEKKIRKSKKEMGKEGYLLRQRVENRYDIRKIVNQYYQVYNSLLYGNERK